ARRTVSGAAAVAQPAQRFRDVPGGQGPGEPVAAGDRSPGSSPGAGETRWSTTSYKPGSPARTNPWRNTESVTGTRPFPRHGRLAVVPSKGRRAVFAPQGGLCPPGPVGVSGGPGDEWPDAGSLAPSRFPDRRGRLARGLFSGSPAGNR